MVVKFDIFLENSKACDWTINSGCDWWIKKVVETLKHCHWIEMGDYDWLIKDGFGSEDLLGR